MDNCVRSGSEVKIVHHRQPNGSTLCRTCAEKEPIVEISASDSGKGHEDLGLEKKRPGMKKPFEEIKNGESLEYRTGKWRDRTQCVDRDKNWYDEVVTDQETGEVIHGCHEPLSEHRGHGSAKAKKRNTLPNGQKTKI